MRRLLIPLALLAMAAGACAAPASHEIDCPQVAVGEQIIVTGAPVSTDSPWGFMLDTVRWQGGIGISVTDWRLGGDLDSDALEAVILGEVAGRTTLSVDYAQLNSEGIGPVRTVNESCEILVVEPPEVDLTGTWRVQRDLGDTVCVGGPTEDEAEAAIAQDSSGNLTIAGINAGYEAWSGAVDVDVVTFGGLRDEPADQGGGTTESTFDLVASSRSRMQGTETWSWTDGTTTCEATTEVTFRK